MTHAHRRCRQAIGALLLLVGGASRLAAADFDLPSDLASYAVLSCQTATLDGGAMVRSEGVADGPGKGGLGHLRSNGDVILNGTVEVQGDVVAGPRRAIRTSGQPIITGAKIIATAPFVCEPVDLANLHARLLAANDNSNLPLTDRGRPALGGKDGKTLELAAGDGLTLPAGTYFLSRLALSGGSQLRLGGRVQLFVAGDILVDGTSYINRDGDPYQLRLWSDGEAVTLLGHSRVFAFLHAPRAGVKVGGGSWLVGGLHGGTVEIYAQARVTRRVDDLPPVIELDEPTEGQSVAGCHTTVSGRVSDNTGTFKVAVLGAVTPAPDGAFSVPVTLGGVAPELVEVVAFDAAGNSAVLQRHVVPLAPAAVLSAPPLDSPVGTQLVDLAGTVSEATGLTINGLPATITKDGSFSLPGFDLGAADGVLPVELVAFSGCARTSQTVYVDKDTLAPSVTIESTMATSSAPARSPSAELSSSHTW